MGRQKLGEFIRKIDYNNVSYEYEDDDEDDEDYDDDEDEEDVEKVDPKADHPSRKLKELRNECKDDITLDEIKDAYAAIEQKVCIKSFPELLTPGGTVAWTTLDVLKGVTRKFLEKHKESTKAVTEILYHTLMAMAKAGPKSTFCDLMVILIKTTSAFKEYIEELDKKSLISVMEALKVDFKYKKSGKCNDEELYATTLRTRLEKIFAVFSADQFKLVPKEFLDVYIHYHALLPNLPEVSAREVYKLIRDMVRKIENENPYLHTADPGTMKKHLKVLEDMACSKNYVYDNPLDDACRILSENIITAALAGGMLADVIDNMMSVIVAIHKHENARKEAHFILRKFVVYLFKAIDEQDITTDSKVLKSCVNMVVAVFTQGKSTCETDAIVEHAIECVILRTTPLSVEDVKQIFKIATAMVKSGRIDLVRAVRPMLCKLKESKSLDWKKHVEEAKQILDAFGEIPYETFQHDKTYERDYTGIQYRDEAHEYIQLLRKGKILPQLQSSLVKYVFDCLTVSKPRKSGHAQENASPDFMDFTNEKKLRLEVLKKCEGLIQNEELCWEDWYYGWAIANMLDIVVRAYDGDGTAVSSEENKLFMSIFKSVSDGGNSVTEHFYDEDNDTICNNRMKIWRSTMYDYINLHRETGTMSCVAPILPNVIRWAKIAIKEKHEDMEFHTFSVLSTVGSACPAEFKDTLPAVVSLMFLSKKYSELQTLVCQLYPHNPSALNKKLQDFFDQLEKLKEPETSAVMYILYTISASHPEVFTKIHVGKILGQCASGGGQSTGFAILQNISEHQPSSLVDIFPRLCNNSIFKQNSLPSRSGIIASVGKVNQKLGETAIDYLMKFALSPDPTTGRSALHAVNSMIKQYQDYIQVYKPQLKKLEKTSKVSDISDLAHDMILILEGKSVENIAEGLQQQQEDMTVLDTKVDATIGTVVTIGGKVTEHEQEIGQLGEGLERVEERVDDVEEDLGDTKMKMEEIDNKTMSNAPKWSRDLTKLMNPSTKNDWRLLASRLGYSNDDIRGWATQHDPCMALLSEWYATHKTSEASYGVLTALTEMNRMDGVVIVENAMKAAEGVVEDEEFEYPSPPPVFISYQWGVQNEVKLLKQHLNMAGYECWLDIGQMGGGDKLFAKIDNGIRGAKVVICCVTEKYAQSPNCNREVNLSVNLNKPIIPLLMEKMSWPPKGSMGPIFSEYLFIRFFQRSNEETKANDKRYWPIPKFQELLMQLNYYVVPDQKLVKKEYSKWWIPIVEDIAIDKTKGKKQGTSQPTKQNDKQLSKADATPLVFLSYQWGKQQQINALYHRLTSLGYSVWMDIYQMGGGDSLYDKIDRGMRGCKAVVSCVTEKYSLSANCRREVSLADALKKPIIPLLLEQMKWPPDGPMSMVFTELLYINMYKDESDQMTWKGVKFNELTEKLKQYLTETGMSSDRKDESKSADSKTTAANKSGGAAALNMPSDNKEKVAATKNKTTEAKNKSTAAVNKTSKDKGTASVNMAADGKKTNQAAETLVTSNRRNNKITNGRQAIDRSTVSTHTDESKGNSGASGINSNNYKSKSSIKTSSHDEKTDKDNTKSTSSNVKKLQDTDTRNKTFDTEKQGKRMETKQSPNQLKGDQPTSSACSVL